MSNSLNIIYCLSRTVVWSPFWFHQVWGGRIYCIPSLLPPLHNFLHMKKTWRLPILRYASTAGYLLRESWPTDTRLSQRPPEKEPWGRGCELQPLLGMWIIRCKENCQLTASLSLSIWDDVEAKRQRWKYKGLGCDRGRKIRQSAIVHQFENSSIQHDRSVRRNRILTLAKLHEQEKCMDTICTARSL